MNENQKSGFFIILLLVSESVIVLVGSVTMLFFDYAEARLLHGEWNILRDGMALVPAAIAIIFAIFSWVQWARNSASWRSVLIGAIGLSAIVFIRIV
jgi:hypothetical protein